MVGSKRKLCDGCAQTLAMPWPFDPTLFVCNSCTKKQGPTKFRLISFTDAHIRFMLDVYDLWCIDQFHTSKANKGAEMPALAQRVKFRKDEVVTLACNKYG